MLYLRNMISQRQIFLKHLAQTSDAPLMLEIERAEGIYLYNTAGRPYIDLISGICVSSLGHCHPKVVQAVKNQADRYLHTMVYGEYVLAPQVQLAQLLSEQLPPSLSSVYFVNSGSEAVEGAMKLAKRSTGRREFVACYNSYHGGTQGALSLMSDSYFTGPFRPLVPGISFIQYNQAEDLTRIDKQTAAVIIEPVQAEAGVRLPKGGFLQKLRQRCDEVGALLIFDEIQVGYGRTGSLFAFEQYDIIPDVLLLAKGMGGGMPLGAFVASQELMQTLSQDPILGHITTFGGHPVSCAAGLATLEVLVHSDWIAQVASKADLFNTLLHEHPAVHEIRYAGLLMAVELKEDLEVPLFIQRALDLGLVLDWFLFEAQSFRIAPPLLITEAQIRAVCEQLLTVLTSLLE